MSKWAVPLEADAVQDGVRYFIGYNVAAPSFSPLYYFVAHDIKGKRVMSQKPGIAAYYLGGEQLRLMLRMNDGLRAFAVPADAHKRWKRRSRRL